MIRSFTLLSYLAMLMACGSPSEPTQMTEKASTEAAVVTGLADGNYVVNKVKPRVTWAAEKLTGDGHNGTLYIESGKFRIEGGAITAGAVIFDMARIECTDLEGDAKSDLEDHLRGGDFFNVESHPKAELRIHGVTEESGVNTLQSTLTLNGVAVDYNIPVQLVEADVPGDVKGLAVQGKFQMDRTKHDIVYQSGTIFEGLDWAIKDDVSIGFSLIGVPADMRVK